MYYKIRNFLGALLLVTFLVTSYLRNDYRSIAHFAPQTQQEPVQKNLVNAVPVTFSQDSYDYTLNPVAEYELSGVVLSSLNYKNWYAMYKYDSTFPKDVCVAWGSNVTDGVLMEPSLRFSQDSRFCRATYDRSVRLDWSKISNNHLLPKDDRIAKLVGQIEEGDQVRLKGKLINVRAVQSGEVKRFDPSQFWMNTSTVRTDTEGGACEIIYVEDVEFLAKGTPELDMLHAASRNLLLLIVAISVISFFITPVNKLRPTDSEDKVRLYKFH